MTSTPSEIDLDDVEKKIERISEEVPSVEESGIEAQSPTTTFQQHLMMSTRAVDNAQSTTFPCRDQTLEASSSEGNSTAQAKSSINSHPQQNPEGVTNMTLSSTPVETPSSAIPSTRSTLPAISIVDQIEGNLKTSTSEEKESYHNMCVSGEATTTASTSSQHHHGEQQQLLLQLQQDDNLRQAPSSSSTLSSSNSAAVVLPSTTKDTGDASIISLLDLGTWTATVNSIHEQPMVDVDQCLVELLVEADNDVVVGKTGTELNEEGQSDDKSSSSNINNHWNEILTVENLTEEEELKVARSASTSGDTDNDSTLSPRDSSSSNTVQTADEAGTDTTYDTDGSLSTASAVDVDLLIEEQYHMVSPLMVGHGDDDYGSEDIMEDDDMHQHPLMPQQPELLMATALTVDSVPTNSGEEEKAEVDEYPIPLGSKDKTGSIEELAMLPEPPDIEPPVGVVSERRIRFEDDADVPPIIDNNRAEYVSATIIKREATQEHGLVFRMVDRELRLSSISETGLFANSPLAPFDRMLRLNDLNVETLDPINASHILDALTGAITIIAQNQGGVKDLVESLITKPDVGSVIGIDFTSVCADEALRKQHLEIARIGQKSLFSASLLHVGDRVLSVNGCEDLDINNAAVLLSSAPDHCVVLACTKLKTKMAIARRPTHQLPPNFNFVRALEEARRHREELRRKQGCYYNSCERPGACANFFQWLGNIYVITIVIVGVSISWNSVKDHTFESNSVGTILKFMALFVGGLLVGFLVNAPWWFRKVGARFSIAQLLCNVVVLVSFFLVAKVFDNAELSAHRKELFFGLFFPLLIIVNLPSVFVRREDGSDGNTISDHDDSSINSDLSDVV